MSGDPDDVQAHAWNNVNETVEQDEDDKASAAADVEAHSWQNVNENIVEDEESSTA